MRHVRMWILEIACVIFASACFVPISEAGWPFSRKRTSVEELAHGIDKLEKKIGLYGAVAVKSPDVWGQARLMAHRDEFEKQMAAELDKFSFAFNAEVARSDQAFLSEAFALSAALAGGTPPPQTLPAEFDVTTTNSTSTSVRVTGTPPNSGFQLTNANGGFPVSLEPEILLDQRKRYLNHLHEIRRINEGDDTADAPGYSLNLVRIPVSVLPGDKTREGYGAEVTITATPYVTRELLPTTFRALVINDLVDQLSLPIVKILDLAWDGLATVPIEQWDQTIAGLIRRNPVPWKDEFDEYVKTGNRSESLNFLPESIRKQLVGLRESFIKDRRQKSISGVLEELQSMSETITITERALDQTEKFTSAASVTLLATPRARRSRYAVSSSQMSHVFGRKELAQMAVAAFSSRDVRECNRGMRLPAVQAFLRNELEAAFDYLGTRGYELNPGDPSVCPPLWQWIPGTLAAEIRGSAAAKDHGQVCSFAMLRRMDFFKTMHLTECVCNIPDWQGHSSGESIDVRNLPCPPKSNTGEVKLPKELQAHNITEALAWAVIVESVLLNDRLKEDVQRVSHDPDCGCQPAVEGAVFYGPNPGEAERTVFMDYVRCRWPLHVFAVDPVTQQQNVADTFGLRREMQIAVALAFSGGRINAQNMTRYIRRLEVDMRTIGLNQTAVGFGHGADTFGWRFFPRVQTPPFEGNLTVIKRDLIRGGPNKDDLLKHQRLEPGERECVAMVVMPSFVTHVTFDIRTNWFELTNGMLTKRADTGASVKDTVEWSRMIRSMQDSAMNCVNDADRYRPGEVQRLLSRVEQLSHRLPLQTVHAQVPYENTLGGFEMFSSGVTDLAPELIGFYGAPGIDPTSSTTLFLVGNHFSVHDSRILAGNKECEVRLMSREVMQVTVPPGVRVQRRYPKPPNVAQSSGTDSETTTPCPDCGKKCPETGDPCCNEAVVEIRLATPYGVASELQIPVVSTPAAAKPELKWTTEAFPLTYFWSQSGTAEFSIEDADIQARPPFRFAIAVPAEVRVPNSKVKLELSLVGANAGVISLPILADVAFDPRANQYVIDLDKFITLQKSIRASIVPGLKQVSKTQPPGILVVRLNATVILSDESTRIPVANEILMPITFTKKN